MKNSVKKALAALIVVAFTGIVNAQDTDHSAHHPAGAASGTMKSDKGGMQSEGMMGKMDMDQMMGMMHDCMEMHKDGKMCEGEMMGKCEKNSSKKDCQKMMKQVKAKDKTLKK